MSGNQHTKLKEIMLKREGQDSRVQSQITMQDGPTGLVVLTAFYREKRTTQQKTKKHYCLNYIYPWIWIITHPTDGIEGLKYTSKEYMKMPNLLPSKLRTNHTTIERSLNEIFTALYAISKNSKPPTTTTAHLITSLKKLWEKYGKTYPLPFSAAPTIQLRHVYAKKGDIIFYNTFHANASAAKPTIVHHLDYMPYSVIPNAEMLLRQRGEEFKLKPHSVGGGSVRDAVLELEYYNEKFLSLCQSSSNHNHLHNNNNNNNTNNMRIDNNLKIDDDTICSENERENKRNINNKRIRQCDEFFTPPPPSSSHPKKKLKVIIDDNNNNNDDNDDDKNENDNNNSSDGDNNNNDNGGVEVYVPQVEVPKCGDIQTIRKMVETNQINTTPILPDDPVTSASLGLLPWSHPSVHPYLQSHLPNITVFPPPINNNNNNDDDNNDGNEGEGGERRVITEEDIQRLKEAGFVVISVDRVLSAEMYVEWMKIVTNAETEFLDFFNYCIFRRNYFDSSFSFTIKPATYDNNNNNQNSININNNNNWMLKTNQQTINGNSHPKTNTAIYPEIWKTLEGTKHAEKMTGQPHILNLSTKTIPTNPTPNGCIVNNNNNNNNCYDSNGGASNGSTVEIKYSKTAQFGNGLCTIQSGMGLATSFYRGTHTLRMSSHPLVVTCFQFLYNEYEVHNCTDRWRVKGGGGDSLTPKVNLMPLHDDKYPPPLLRSLNPKL